MNSTRVLALLALFLGLAHSFSWDIVVGEKQRLAFYFNGTLTHTEEVPSASYITSLTYDPVHYRVLFADYNHSNKSIFSFYLTTKKILPIVTKEADGYFMILDYDPFTQLLFWKEGLKIYSRSLKPASSNEAAVVYLFRKLELYCRDLAVDSCGGYIYWTTDYEIVRARFDGSETEVLIQKYVVNRGSFAIDQQTQKMYWAEKITKNDGYLSSIESADFNGKNRRRLYTIKNKSYVNSLTVSKDFIYWNDVIQKNVWQFPKNPQNNAEAKLLPIPYRNCLDCKVIAANYSIKEQTQGIPKCEALKSLTQNNSKTDLTEVSLMCVHGTEVSGESRCECAQGYTGERCEVSLCYNYCLQGDCSVSVEGHPKCSCSHGYSGVRCEVNACHKHCFNDGVCSLNEAEKPICQCTADYQGERCDVSICKDYCLQGNCSIITEGQRTCSCNAGYSGERCEVNACHSYCLNNGDCSLNEEDEPFCQCTAGYEGERCDVATTLTDVCICADKSTTQQIIRNLRSKVNQVISEELQCTL